MAPTSTWKRLKYLFSFQLLAPTLPTTLSSFLFSFPFFLASQSSLLYTVFFFHVWYSNGIMILVCNFYNGITIPFFWVFWKPKGNSILLCHKFCNAIILSLYYGGRWKMYNKSTISLHNIQPNHSFVVYFFSLPLVQ